MQDLTPSITVSADVERRIVRFSASGLWGEAQISEGGAKIGMAAAPFIKARQSWTILADYSNAITQPRETAVEIRKSFEMAASMGLKRIAVINSPTLVMMQYKRLVDLVEIEFFANKVDALGWLSKVAPAA